MRSYTVVGLGAIGGYYGARLQQAGCACGSWPAATPTTCAATDCGSTLHRATRVLDVDVHDDPSDAGAAPTW